MCLLNNNSRFADMHLVQTNGTVVKSCSYLDIVIPCLYKIINGKKTTEFQPVRVQNNAK